MKLALPFLTSWVLAVMSSFLLLSAGEKAFASVCGTSCSTVGVDLWTSDTFWILFLTSDLDSEKNDFNQSTVYSDNSGAVGMGSMGSAEPINFE